MLKLKQRLVTALLLIPLLVWEILYLPSLIFALILSIFIIIAAWEWAAICGWQTKWTRQGYATAVFFSLWLAYALLLQFPPGRFYLLLIGCLWWLLALRWVIYYQNGWHSNPIPQFPLTKALLGLFILLPAWASLVILHEERGGQLVLFFMVLIWMADSAAYFSGKLWGKIKLADKISPGKTWEGLTGALISSVLIAGGYALFKIPSWLGILTFLSLCLITIFTSVLGDLLESLFKRQMGIKDSSQFLPGHGGMLDRIDSLTAAAPVFVLGIVVLGIKF